MNLIYTLTAYPPSIGGAQRHQHRLSIQFIKRHNVQVVSFWDQNRTDWLLGTTLRTPDQVRNYQVDGVPVHLLGFSMGDKLRMLLYVSLYYSLMEVSVKQIASLIEKKLESFSRGADLIHNVRIGREPLSYASFQIARKQDVPFVFTPVHHPRWGGWLHRIYHQLYRHADALIALTGQEKQTLIRLGVHEDRIYITGNGPDLADEAYPERFRNSRHIQGPFVLFIGQNYAYKGFRQLLDASELIWKKIPETEFVFIGPQVGDSETIFRAYSDRRIHYLGPVSQQEKTNALAACDLLCVPSTQESFGGVYTEAWSFEKPVIGCRIPAVSEVITDGVDGYLVNQQAGEIAESIVDLLANPSNAERMGKAGYQKVRQRYTWGRLAELTENVYKNAVGK